MAITKTIENILPDVKRHLRIFHNEDDSLIKNEIAVSIINIHTQIMLIPEKLEDGSVNPNFPADNGNNAYVFEDRVLLAIKHYTTTLRTNPDERVELQAGRSTVTTRLIESILGAKRDYFEEY